MNVREVARRAHIRDVHDVYERLRRGALRATYYQTLRGYRGWLYLDYREVMAYIWKRQVTRERQEARKLAGFTIADRWRPKNWRPEQEWNDREEWYESTKLVPGEAQERRRELFGRAELRALGEPGGQGIGPERLRER